MTKCHYCKEKEGISIWDGHKFCQSCSSIIYTIWKAQHLRKRHPQLIQYANDQILDKFAIDYFRMDNEEKIMNAAYKKLDEFGIHT
jgi:hypothetical protein